MSSVSMERPTITVGEEEESASVCVTAVDVGSSVIQVSLMAMPGTAQRKIIYFEATKAA